MEDKASNDLLARQETWTLSMVSQVGRLGEQKYATASEAARLRHQFESDANKVLEAIGSGLEKTLSAMDSLAVTLVAFAQYSNSTWPYVTMPNFVVTVAKILLLTGINVLSIVQPHQRVPWERYSRANDTWVNESMKLQETWNGYYGPVNYDWEPNPILHGLNNLPYNLTKEPCAL
jgi:hypothetical protein